MSQIADTWKGLCSNAEKFHLDPVKFNAMSEFFAGVDKNIFREFAVLAPGKFPMAKAQELFSGRELEMFLMLCIVANYDHAVEKYHAEGWPDYMLNEILMDLRLWMYTLEPDMGGYGVIPRLFYWSIACLTGGVVSYGRLQGNSMHCFCAQNSLYRQADGSLVVRKAYQKDNPPNPDLAPDDKVINIHIPARGALLRKECIKSLKRMVDFSAQFYPDYDYKAIVCYSWLLDPQFQKLLKPESNIVQFQKLGHIFYLEGHNQDSEIRWRIWGNKGNTLPLDQLSADNSLKRAVIQTLQSGGHFTEGVLVIFKDELPKLFAEL